MSKTEHDLFDGKPVMEFESASDRRNFLRTAAKMGMGSALVFTGVACNDDGSDDLGTGASPPAAETEEPNPTATEKDEQAAQVPASDIDILNYALTLEALEADFYAQGVKQKAVSGRELDIVKSIGAHEAAHVDVLTQTIQDLGAEPVNAPKFKYPSGTFNDRAKFLKTASTFEELGVTAYHGQVTKIKTPDLLAAAASIAGVESRHAAVVAKMIGGQPFPRPVEATKPMDAVLKAVQPFIKS